MDLGALISVLAAQTQIPGTPYTRFSAPITYTELQSPVILVSSGANLAVEVTLPFAFRFYGQTVTEIVAGSAGCLALAPVAQISGSNQQPGTNTAFQNIDGFIAPWWDSTSMQPNQDAHLAFEVTGAAPNRRVTFQWKRANRSFSSTGMEWYNFQVRLYEGLSGRIEIDYGARDGTLPSFVSATAGMESLASDMPILFASSACTTNCQVVDYDALAGTRITFVQDPGIELVALAVRAPEFATLGVPTPVPVILANLNGAALGPFRVELSASLDRSGSGGTSVGSLDLSLGAYQTEEVSVMMTAPLLLGEASYYLELDVDTGGAIQEVDEMNNVLASPDRVRFLAAKPDLSIDRVIAGETMSSAGGQVTVTAEISNIGSLDLMGEAAIMMSTNTAISPQDVELDRFLVSLGPGEATSMSRVVTVPAGTNSGTYHLGALGDPDGDLDEVSESNNGRAALTSLTVAGGDLAILTTTLPAAVVGRTYVAILSAIGGVDVSWRVTSGALPLGIGLVATTGELFGRAQVEGTFPITVEASSGGQVDAQDLEIVALDPDEPLTVVTRALPIAIAGQEYAFALRAAGGSSTSALSWSAASLPDGFALEGDGSLLGSAVATGTTTIEVSVTNGLETAMRSLSLIVRENANLQIIAEELPAGVWSEVYLATIRASGGVPPISFVIEVGDLPDGLDLDTDGRLSGTPLEVGKFRLVVRARDSGAGGVAATDVNTFELVVNDAPGFHITTTALAEAITGQGYRATVTAAGGLPPYEWSLDGRLSGALLAQIDDTTGDFSIVGTAGEPGVTNLLISARDRQGRTARRALALIVKAAVVEVTPPEDAGCGCTASKSDSEQRPGSIVFLVIALAVLFRTRA